MKQRPPKKMTPAQQKRFAQRTSDAIQGKTRYLVIREVYSRDAMSAPTFRFVSAESFEALVRKEFKEEIELDDCSDVPFKSLVRELEASNGDGRDFVTIVDLRNEKVVFGLHN